MLLDKLSLSVQIGIKCTGIARVKGEGPWEKSQCRYLKGHGSVFETSDSRQIALVSGY